MNQNNGYNYDWWNHDGLSAIYSPTYSMDDPEKLLFDRLFDRASGIGYAQPPTGGAPTTGSDGKPGGWELERRG